MNLAPQTAKTKRGRTIPIADHSEPSSRTDSWHGATIAPRLPPSEPGQARATREGLHEALEGCAQDSRAVEGATPDKEKPDQLVPYDLRRTALRNMVRGGTTTPWL